MFVFFSCHFERKREIFFKRKAWLDERSHFIRHDKLTLKRQAFPCLESAYRLPVDFSTGKDKVSPSSCLGLLLIDEIQVGEDIACQAVGVCVQMLYDAVGLWQQRVEMLIFYDYQSRAISFKV